MAVVRIARQAAAGFMNLADAAEEGDAVPTLLAVLDRVVSESRNACSGKVSSGAFSSCRQTTSGPRNSSQRNSTGKRLAMPLTW